MAFRADNRESSSVGDTFAKEDVNTASGHVCGHRHGARLSRLRNNCRFFLMLLRVQHLVLNALPVKQA